jgi:hypothetical protein
MSVKEQRAPSQVATPFGIAFSIIAHIFLFFNRVIEKNFIFVIFPFPCAFDKAKSKHHVRVSRFKPQAWVARM